MVQNMLESESGLTVDRSLSADESVAHGAAIYAGILLQSGGKAQSRISVSNVNSHDLGILGLDSSTGFPRRSVMIPRNTQLPKKIAKRFSTSRDSQASVAVNVIEGGDEQGRHSTGIGKCVVRDLPSDLPKATPVEVIFNYGQDGRLQIVAQLPSIGKKAALTIERGSGLSEQDLAKWKNRIEGGILEQTDEVGAAPVQNKSTPPDTASDDRSGSIPSPAADNSEPDFSDPDMFPDAQQSFELSDFAVVTEPSPAPSHSPAPQDVTADSSAAEGTSKPKARKGGWKSRRKQVSAGDDE